MRLPPRLLPLLAALLVAGPRAAAQLFLVDDRSVPHVSISWPTADAGVTRLERGYAYRTVGEREWIGGNIDAYVMLGGVRLNRGLGHPRGAIVRVGLAKAEMERPFFEGIAAGGAITITLGNLAFTQPPAPRPQTLLQEIGYGTDPSLCGLPGQPEAMYNTLSRTDTLREKLTPTNSRLGVFDGAGGSGASAAFHTDEEGRLSVTIVIPYAILRHVKDPWLRTTPGGFNEPNHFHVEFEVLPAGVAAAEDAAQAAALDAGTPLPPLPVDGSPPPETAERFPSDAGSVARGRFLFLSMGCWTCHGREGGGDGPGAAGLLDVDGKPIEPADFTTGVYKSGPAPEDLYRTISAGSPGTPMVGFRPALIRRTPDGGEDDSEIRALVAYVRSLAPPK